jgi:hypothetical protein
MKKIAILAAVASTLIGAPAFAGGGGKGLAINANVLTGTGGVLGLLNGTSGLGINANVSTGKGGVLGAILGGGGRGGRGGGHSGSGCGC